ncbi:transposase family protein [Streptomyces sp. MT29]|nr:transposase family protein [Streptomyces sp. MT29]
MATINLVRSMGNLFKECEHPESRWPRCPHDYKIRYRNAAGQQAEENDFSPQEKAKARLSEVYQARKSNPQNQHKAERTEILADAGYQGLGAQTGGRVVTPPHRKFKKNPPEWYEEMHERQRKAHSSRRIRVEHGIGHLKNWRSLARHHGRREHMSDTIQAVAGLLSHQQAATASGTRT